jgi:hypothetical protein
MGNENTKMVTELMENPGNEEIMKKIFDKYDTDKSGYLNLKEFKIFWSDFIDKAVEQIKESKGLDKGQISSMVKTVKKGRSNAESVFTDYVDKEKTGKASFENWKVYCKEHFSNMKS